MNFAAGLLILIGWGGLYYLVNNVRPQAGPRWYFFILLYLGVVGIGLPIIRFFNMLLTRERTTVTDGVILRQALLLGLYVVILAWLQILRVMSLFIAVFLAIGFIAIEVFVRIRERMQFFEEE
jgi:hypothetical protein